MAARPSTLQRNLLLDLSSSIGLGTTMAVVGVLLPSMARLDGLSSMGLAALAALPFAASLLSILAGRIGPRTPRQLAITRALGSAALALVFLVPHPVVIMLATFAFWSAWALGVPLQQRLWAEMYPTDRRGRLLGIVGTGRFAAGTLALLVCGLVIDGSLGVTIIAVVAVLGTVSALATSRLRLADSAPARRFSIGDSVASITRNTLLRRLTYAQIAFGAGIVAAPALVAIVQIDQLHLGLDDIALAGLATYLTIAVAFGLWGRFASRVGGLATAAVGSGLGAISILVFAAAPDLATIILASAILGAGLAAVDVSWPLVIAEHASDDEQAAAAAGLNTIMGARGLVAPFAVMIPVQMGVLDVTSGLLVCALVAGTGTLLYLWAAGLLRTRPSRALEPIAPRVRMLATAVLVLARS